MMLSREQRQRLGEKRRRGGIGEGPSHPTIGTDPGAEVAGDQIPKKRRARVSCAAVHSYAWKLMVQDCTASLVAAMLVIGRPSLR